MKWRKLGLKFSFNKYQHLINKKYVGFTQSPQVLVIEDRIRVYYCTRSIDNQSKYRSHVQFVDFDKSFDKIINHSKNQVIELGDIGCFDEHGIFPFNIIRYKKNIYAYTNGWSRRVSVDIETGIGFAQSYDNGETFIKKGRGPILSAEKSEPFLVGDAFVMYEKSKFHMYYIFGKKWFTPEKNHVAERVYKITYAESSDGISWNRSSHEIVKSVIDVNECQALPTVVKIGNVYHMYFCYRCSVGFREEKDRGYRLGYAYSNNLTDWIRDDNSAGITVSNSGWDSEMMCYPHIFKNHDGNVNLLYNGNEFGKYGFGLAILEND